MSQIARHKLHVITALFTLTLLVGCGSDPNPQANFNPDTGLHAAGWSPTGHRDAARNNVASCTDCHGDDYSGGISKVSCWDCHPNGGSGQAPSCSTCHGDPPVTGKHTEHLQLFDCFTCHVDTLGALQHNDGTVDLDLAVYDAKTGTATFTDPNCTNISCHGGQMQDWLSGASIDVNTQCTACHAGGTIQYNSYVTAQGSHSDHLPAYDCWECHDTGKLSAVHFNDLNTPGMTEAWKTIINDARYTGTGGTYGNCTITCHGEGHNNRRW